MHPEIHASKPGKCPKCGMDLVKEKQNLLKNHCAKTSSKAAVKKTGTAKTNGVEVKETENLHKIITCCGRE
jgi:hypothetical protein